MNTNIRYAVGTFAALLCIASTAFAQDTTVVTPPPDSIASGVQGSINSLRDNTPVLTGDDLLDRSFPDSIPLFGSGIRWSAA